MWVLIRLFTIWLLVLDGILYIHICIATLSITSLLPKCTLLNQNPDFWNPRFFNTADDSNQTKIPFTSQTLYSNFAPDFSNLIIFWTSYTITFPKVVTKIGIPLYLYIWACRERNPSNRKVSKQARQWQGMSLDLQIWSCSSC